VGSDADVCSKADDQASTPTFASTTAGRKCRETFLWGLRNPFRFAVDPNTTGTTTRLFVNDVGQNAWEEVDLGQSGADYGWSCREGAHANVSATAKCNPAPLNMVDPVFEYGRSGSLDGVSGCGSITGAAFAPTGYWPSTHDEHFFFADYNCGAIFHLTSDTGPAAKVATALGSSSATSLAFDSFGTTKALYYTSYASGGQLHRIRPPTSGNHAPVAVASGTPLLGQPPLDVTFSAAGSSDADLADSLTYFWTFGDGTPETSTAGPTIQHTYTTAGAYTASLRVRDPHLAFSSPVTVTIQAGNTAPVATISAPVAGASFAVGETVTLTGEATDAEDGALSPSALSWTLLLHHGAHTHPFLGPVVGNSLTFTFPAPEDLAAAASSFIEVTLTATDSQGGQGTATRDAEPRKVNVSFQTNPSGLTLLLQNAPVTAPHTAISWEGYPFAVTAPDQTGGETTNYTFSSWSDAGAATHTVTTPRSPVTLTAAFTGSPTPNGRSFVPVTPCRLLDTRDSASPLTTGVPQTFHVGPSCGVPLTAKAISINIAAVAPTAVGHLSFIPAGGAPSTSAINFIGSRTGANNAVLPLDAGGVFTVSATLTDAGNVHLIVDVNGYFE
jgi:PKD repeat protein